MTRWDRLRAFGGAFLLTLCGVMLAAGLLLADVNSRHVTFGDGTPPYATVGGDRLRDTLQSDRLSSFLPARLTVLCWLWEGEQWLFQLLIEW